MPNHRRVYRHYSEREECAPGGMWRILNGPERDDYVAKAATLMRDSAAFHAAMMRAVVEWPASCEVNLTTESMNHRAWFGHAGCFLATGSPEDCTRLAWHTLAEDEQREANRVADDVIAEWHRRYAEDSAQLAMFEEQDAET